MGINGIDNFKYYILRKLGNILSIELHVSRFTLHGGSEVVAMVSVLTLLLCSFNAGATESTQLLMKGQSTTIALDYEVGDIAVADRSVCDYLVGQDRRSVYINGRGGGETTMTLWDADGVRRDEFVVRVVTTTLKEVLDRAHNAFGDLRGVRIEVRGGRVEVSGEVAEPEDYRQIEALARSDPRMRNRVSLSSDVIDQVASAIEDAIGVPGVTARSVRDRVVLEGVAYSPADAKRAAEIAKLYSPEVLNLIEVQETGRRIGRGNMIELEFHMMEIKRSALRTLGVQWAPGSFPKGGAANAGTGSGAGLFSSIDSLASSVIGFVFQLVPKVRFIRERGDGRVLENPSVIVKNGEVAKIFSGSEIPYYRDEEVQFKKVGVDIHAEPIEVDGGVDIKLTASLSSPSPDIRGGIDTNTVSTSAICRSGQSLVLANIIRNGDVKMKNRVPSGIDTSSALFTLFLSKDFQSNRSTFVIFVTPRVIDEPTAAEARLRDFIATEEAMMRDRSQREFAEYVRRHAGGGTPDGKALKGKRRRGRKGKWR